MQHSTFYSWTHSVMFDYLCVTVPMVVALIERRAGASKLLLSPLWAIPVLVAAATVVSLASIPLQALGVLSESALEYFLQVLGYMASGYISGLFFARKSASSHWWHRGSVVSDESRKSPSADRAGQLSLAGLCIAPEDETKHFKFIGTTGTGKSTAIREILNSALARGDRAVIADPDGGYLNNFYDASRGDVILNPFSAEGLRWNPLDEIINDYDVDQLACSLIPDNGDADRTWIEHARAFFIAVTQQARAAGLKEDSDLYRLLIKAPVKELRLLLANTAAGPLLEEGNERMFGSVRSTAGSALRPLEYTTRQQAPYFSVRNWVRHGAAARGGGSGGVLFIPYKAGEIAALRSLISAWVRIAIFEAMDRDEGDQRLWFVVDELDALGPIDGLKDALARLRKFGGRTIIGFQSIAQVSGTYGKAAADTIVENCGNTLILRCSTSERGGTAEFASKLIGQREVLRTMRSVSRRSDRWLESSITTSEQLKIEPAVMASEIEQLADLEGFLKFASTPNWNRVRLTPVRYPIRVRPRGPRAEAPMANGTATDGSVDGAMAGAVAPAAVTKSPDASVAPDPGSATLTRSDRRVGSPGKKNTGKNAESTTRKKAVRGVGVSAKPQGNGKDPQGEQSDAPSVSNGAAPTTSSGSSAELG